VLVFERFTAEARGVVVDAQEEARRLRHSYIGTEHILLGCFSNTEVGAGAALSALGLRADRVREDVVRTVGLGEDPSSGQIPFTPRAKKVMELGLREAQSLGHEHIESLHLLLGLIHEREGVAMRILLESGVSPERIRETAISMLPAGETVEHGRHLAPVQQARAVKLSTDPTLKFTVTPDHPLRRLLMAAAGRALVDGREEFGIEDLRAVIDEEPPGSEATSA
jgi:ATP-dependent Clp protease ATP-binding subunit ClpA